MSNASYATLAGSCPDSDLALLHELLTYDAAALDCCDLHRLPNGSLEYKTLPSTLHWSRQTEWPWALREAALEPHHTVLEAGGGGCVMKYPAAKRCKHVTIADIDEEDMRHTERAIDLLGFENITQVLADLRRLPFPSNWFDRVICTSVLEHIADHHEKGIDEMVRVLKPGGILLLTMDVILQGIIGQTGHFYLDMFAIEGLVQRLGITEIHKPAMPLAAFLEKDNVVLGVVMVKYVKGQA
jgi:ubiquinone/menaquinone biosynthesis C-methylase UbiE